MLSAGRRTKVAEHVEKVALDKMANHITLLATIEDSQKIQLAKKSPGSLSLSLRGDGDLEMLGTESTNLEQLLKTSTAVQDKKSIFIDKKEYILEDGSLVSKNSLTQEKEEKNKLLNARSKYEAELIRQKELNDS